MTLPFTFTIDTVPDEMVVVSFRGHEAASSPFRFEVQALSSDSLDPERVLGLRAQFNNAIGDAVRTTCGIITACELSSRRADGRTVSRLRLEPTLATLKHRSHWRIFHDQTVLGVVSELLTPLGIPFDWKVARTPDRKPHRTQRGERDLSFLHRMLADEGIFYWFDHTREREWLVFADDANMYSSLPGATSLRHAGLSDSSSVNERSLLGLARNHRLRPTSQSTRLFDPKRPFRGDESGDSHGAASHLSLESYEHASEGLAQRPSPARRRLGEARARASVAHATCLYPHIAPGHVFQLTDHSEESLNGGYAITRVDHEGHAARDGEAKARSYECKVSLVPRSTPMLIECARSPVATGLETATVMGPELEEIHTDELGRVQVRFHWDHRTEGHPAITAWVRVSQGWGGAGYGATFTPRVGNEVLVGYIDGDPDRPIIVGSVHNALSLAAPRFPHERTRNGIATRSSPASGDGHCLMFEDKRGEELLELRSCKTLAVSAVGDSVVSSGNRYDLTVGTDRTETIGGAHHESVGGDASLSYSGTRETKIAGDDSVQIAGSSTSFIGGSMVERVGGSVVSVVEGGRQSFVGAGSELPCHESLAVSGSYSLGAAYGVRIGSPRAIELEVGSSRISILPDRILIESSLIQLQAEKAIRLIQGEETPAATMVLEGSASLSGGTATVSSGQGGILALDAEAKLNGALVKLNCDAASGGGAERIVDTTKDGQASFRVLPHGLPAGTSHVTLVVQTPSGERVERECPVGGTATFEGHPGESFALVDVKIQETSYAYVEPKRKVEGDANG